MSGHPDPVTGHFPRSDVAPLGRIAARYSDAYEPSRILSRLSAVCVGHRNFPMPTRTGGRTTEMPARVADVLGRLASLVER